MACANIDRDLTLQLLAKFVLMGPKSLRDFEPLSNPDKHRWPLLRTVEHCDAQSICFELRAHNALTPRGAWLFLATVSIGPMLTAGFCVWQGFWPVLPFAGLELLLLYVALRWSRRKGQQRQNISISQDFVTITSQLGVPQAKTRFPRHWTRVKLCGSRFRHLPTRLLIESSGQACEVGAFLTEDERRDLAKRLQELVGRMNESPRLPS